MLVEVAISIVFILCACILWHIANKRGAHTLFWATMGAVFGPFAIPFIFLTKKNSSGASSSPEKNHRVCPVEMSFSLDNRIRRWVQNPRVILKPHIQEGMTVLDVGCGPGFFSIDMAALVGASGQVIAADLQEGMLEKIRNKIRATDLEARISVHRCASDRIGVTQAVDFVLVFYMFHEVPNKEAFLAEIGSIIKPDGRVLLVEPPLHVSQSAFEAMIEKARSAGFELVDRPKVFLSKAALLKSK